MRRSYDTRVSSELEIKRLSRRDAAVAEIVRRWRELTGGRATRDAGRRTVVACSGGADSSALVLALARVRPGVTVAHVVHDLRLAEQALADRDATKQLAEKLGLEFVEASVRVRDGSGASREGTTNLEARARRARYAALAELAQRAGCSWVATGHHADDQLETVLMRLMRGTGPTGLGGIADARPIGRGVTLVRPMLSITREDARRLCIEAGWSWREDATNADESLLRSAVRHRVVPLLLGLAPAVRGRVATTARLSRGAGDVVRGRASELLAMACVREGLDSGEARKGGGSRSLEWPRGPLRSEPGVVIGELLRLAFAVVISDGGAGGGLDRVPARSVMKIAAAARGESTEPKVFRLGPARVGMTARLLTVSAADAEGSGRVGSNDEASTTGGRREER